MSLIDRANEIIVLSLVRLGTPVLRVNVYRDSSIYYQPWVWLSVEHAEKYSASDRSWMLTLNEARQLRDRLTLIVGDDK